MKIIPEQLYNILRGEGIDFFTGVPDSTLKHFCFYLDEKVPSPNHVITANEGNSIGVATGYYLSTGKIPLVYMQNSGFGNAINPLTSLVDKELFAIPMLVMLGWRGEPGKKDAIQHLKDGRIQLDLLRTLELPYSIIPSRKTNLETQIHDSIVQASELGSPYILLVRKNSFEPYVRNEDHSPFADLMSREEALSEIVACLEEEDIVVSTTGKTSRELNELRKKLNYGNHKDFFMTGSMGHASSISLGISLQKSKRTVYCIDGDGALIMHMGSLSTIGKYSSGNFKHILLNNYSHDSVGGQESSSDVIDYSLLSKSMSYKGYFQISQKSVFPAVFDRFKKSPGPAFLEIIVKGGSRKDLGRPDFGPQKNKEDFMEFLGA